MYPALSGAGVDGLVRVASLVGESVKSLGKIDSLLHCPPSPGPAIDFPVFCEAKIAAAAYPALSGVVSSWFGSRFSSHSASDEARASLRRDCDSLDGAGLISANEASLWAMVAKATEARVEEACAGTCDRTLSETISWSETTVIPFLEDVLGRYPAKLSRWTARLRFFVFERFAAVRTAMVFDMAKDFPGSTGALHDLREALQKTSRYSALRDELVSVVCRRLLSMAVSTSDILMTYIRIVKAMKIIDPTDVLVEHVSAPIREYLKKRKDTVQCVVDAFIRESWEDIVEAFREKPSAPEDSNPELWVPEPATPEPVLAPGQGTSPETGTARAADVVALLEGLWGGTEAFVDQYAEALGSSLLSLTDWQADRELRQIELLKMRFGESVMARCEVSVRDVAESRRLSQQMPPVSEDFVFTATVVSHMYWPDAIKEEDTAVYESLPAPIKAAMDTFSAKYAKLRPMRKLQWIGSQGLVSIEISAPDSDMPADFKVSPTLATVISCFSEKATWTAKGLSERLTISAEVAKKSLAFWCGKGVIAPSRGDPDTFCVGSDASSRKAAPAADPQPTEPQSPESALPPTAPVDVDDEVSGLVTGLLVTGTGLTMSQLISGVVDLMQEIAPSVVRIHVDALVKAGKLIRNGDFFQANPDAM